jgi:hypothetical protein
VEGSVAAAETSEPLAGAVVYLLDTELQGIRAVLSDGTGGFRFVAPEPGRYSLRIERIGFETSLFPPFEVPEGGVRNLRLAVQVRPIELEGLSVTAESVCDIAGDGGDLVRVWSEARKTLVTTALTEAQGNLEFTLEVSQRTMNRRFLVLVEQVDTLRTARNSAFGFVPVDELGDAGWGRIESDAVEVYGPSPQILLSPWFTDHHCLGLAPPSADSLVGLAFSSKEGVFQVGIAGTFWFNRSWLLERISFRFTGLPALDELTEQAGEIVLAAGRSGSWYVHSWQIRVPSWRARQGGLFGGRGEPEIMGYVETGGRVIALTRGP